MLTGLVLDVNYLFRLLRQVRLYREDLSLWPAVNYRQSKEKQLENSSLYPLRQLSVTLSGGFPSRLNKNTSK